MFAGMPPPVTVHVPRRDGGADVYGPPRASGDWKDEPAHGASGAQRDASAIADVSSQQDAALMGDLILRLIAGFARQEDTEVHVSLAGGRKTMSAHALLAATLVGRPGFEASHVLVSPSEFEDNTAFWHPDQGGKIAPSLPSGVDRSSSAKLLDPKRAKVTLVLAPTPYLRYRVKDALVLERLSLVDLIAEHNAASEFAADPRVRLLTSRNALIAGGRQVTLSARLFAVYRVVATARKENWAGVGPEGTGGTNSGWLSVPQICFGTSPDGQRISEFFFRALTEAVQASSRDNDTGDNRSLASWKAVMGVPRATTMQAKAEGQFNPNLTNLRNKLLKEFGGAIGSRLAPASREDGFCMPLVGFPDDAERAPRFGLDLPAASIEITCDGEGRRA
jgi:hypothetical protein